MSTTRLLILGAVRIFQPVHGYHVRRELISWEVDSWANLNPGSVYNALRKLSGDGFLAEGATEPASLGAPRTTTYSLTAEGESEFRDLLRDKLTTVDVYAADSLMAGVAFMWALPRHEVLHALEGRLPQILARNEALNESIDQAKFDPEIPQHVREIKRLLLARLTGEKQWTEALIEQVAAGAYVFAGEPRTDYFGAAPDATAASAPPPNLA